MVMPCAAERLSVQTDALASHPTVARPTERPERSRWSVRSRLALGLLPTPRPGLMLLPLGMALGPQGLGLLSAGALASIDPVIAVAVATLGVLVGLDVRVRPAREAVLLGIASVEAGVTIVAVAAGMLAVYALWPASGSLPWMFALMLGLCASSSSTPADPDPEADAGRRVGDLDDVLPVVLSAVAFAAMRHSEASGIIGRTAQVALIALMIAAAAWLLVDRADSDNERRAFTIGALLLMGGAAAHVSQSALFAGLVAGLLWSTTGAQARDRLARDLQYLQHPLVGLLLLVAGARLRISAGVFELVAAYVLFRVLGKLAGGWLVARLAQALRLGGPRAGQAETAGVPGPSLLSPGVVGIAIALTAPSAIGVPGTDTLFAIVVAGSLASELVAFLGIRAHVRA